MLKYNDNQIKAVADRMRGDFLAGSLEADEIVITLAAMHKAERITTRHVKEILNYVFFNNTEGIIRAVIKAKNSIDEDLINSIITEVENPPPM